MAERVAASAASTTLQTFSAACKWKIVKNDVLSTKLATTVVQLLQKAVIHSSLPLFAKKSGSVFMIRLEEDRRKTFKELHYYQNVIHIGVHENETVNNHAKLFKS